MLRKLFEQSSIPADRPVLVHARLQGIHARTGNSYRQLSAELIDCLMDCRPSLLLVPAFTIYSFMTKRSFQREDDHSEVGRFSEEVRLLGYPRTYDPMYSVLDIFDNLPSGLDFSRTFGPQTVMDYLRQQNGLIINVDMPGFYATPIHSVEFDHQVPYRFVKVYEGRMQTANDPWIKTRYTAYVREVSRCGTDSFPPYNQMRRLDYLRKEGAISEFCLAGISLAWGSLNTFCQAVDQALERDIHFLVDPVSAP